MIVIPELLPKPNVLVINQTVSQQLSHGQVALTFVYLKFSQKNIFVTAGGRDVIVDSWRLWLFVIFYDPWD